jgi:hypothetical protein
MDIQDQNASILAMNVRRSRKTGERGGTILEFAFILVISFVLIFAIIDFARAFYSFHFISEAAREGTRFASVRGGSCSPSAVSPCPAFQSDIASYVMQLVPSGINPGSVRVTPDFPGSDLPMCGGTPKAGCPVTVAIEYDFNFIFPVSFYNLPPISYLPSTITMHSISQMTISR